MEEFKNNSNALKEDRPKIEAVTSNVKVKKESEISKFSKRFVSEDAKSVGAHLVDDVIVPTIQKLITDGVKNAIDWIIYGYRGSSKSSSNGVSNISYSKYYTNQQTQQRQTQVARPNVYNINDFIFEDRGEAEEVLLRLREELEKYGLVRVSDFYDLISQKHTYTDVKYGWTDLRDAEVVRARDGYSIDFPTITAVD